MSAPLPDAYAWLPALPGLPRMIQEGLALYGILEAPGEADNPQILAWAREVGLAGVYRHDATAWCGLYMALVAKRAGKSIPAGPLWALNWSRWGQPSPEPSLGDVLTFRRQGGGHVALYVGEDHDAYHTLGGNQGDRVSIVRITKARLAAARRPEYRVMPASVRPYHLNPIGVPLSRNES